MSDVAPPKAPAYDIEARHAEILGPPPRIGPLGPHELTGEAKEIAQGLLGASGGTPDPNAKVPDVIATMLRHPRMFRPHLALAKELFQTELPFRDREILILTVGWYCKAPFEWEQHTKLAHRAGLTSEEIQRIKNGSKDPAWSEDDRAVIQAVEELIADAMITDSTWAKLEKRLDDKALAEICVLVGQYLGVAYYQNSLRCRLMDGGEGLKAG